LDKPAHDSESHKRLKRIRDSTPRLEHLNSYAKSLEVDWTSPDRDDKFLYGVKHELLGDARKLNSLLEDQIEIAKDSSALSTELDSAWSAAETNAKIARAMIRKAELLPDQRMELIQMRGQLIALQQEKSFKDALADQTKAVQASSALGAAEKAELQQLRGQLAALQQEKSFKDALADQTKAIQASSALGAAEKAELQQLRQQVANPQVVKDALQSQQDAAVQALTLVAAERAELEDYRQKAATQQQDNQVASALTSMTDKFAVLTTSVDSLPKTPVDVAGLIDGYNGMRVAISQIRILKLVPRPSSRNITSMKRHRYTPLSLFDGCMDLRVPPLYLPLHPIAIDPFPLLPLIPLLIFRRALGGGGLQHRVSRG